MASNTKHRSVSPKPKRQKITKSPRSRQDSIPGVETKVAAMQVFATEAFQTWLACGKCANAYGAPDIAINSFNAALKYDPYNRQALCGLASASRLKDIKENTSDWSKKVVQIITNCIQQFPDLGNDSNFWKELAECHLISGSAEQAHSALQRAIEINPKDPSLWLLSGQALVRACIINGAVQSLNQALQSLPDSTSSENVDILRLVHAELAAIYASEGDIELATNELKITLSLPPPPPDRVDEHAALWCALATLRERAGDILGALSLCNAAHTAIGDYPRVLITHAYLLLLNGTQFFNPHHAIALLDKVLQMEQNIPRGSPESYYTEDFLPIYLKGHAYTLMESYKEAYDAFQLALRRCPSSPIPWLAVGGLYLHLGQLADALSAYSQLARLQSDEAPTSSPKPQQRSSPSRAIAAATAWEGLSCVYERCDDQANDAADASMRAGACFASAGDVQSAAEAQKRAEVLRQVARREIPHPPFREAPQIPAVLLRDLVPLSQSERIEILKENEIVHRNSTQNQQSQDNAIPAAELAERAQTSPNSQSQQQAQGPPPPLPPQFDSQGRRGMPPSIHIVQQGPPPPPPQVALQQQPPMYGLNYGKLPGGYYYGAASPNGIMQSQQLPPPMHPQQQQQQHGAPPGYPYHPSYVPVVAQLQTPAHPYPVQGEWM